jgi:tRNA dimethylallyltransferase
MKASALSLPPVIAIAGPTAAGKSALALDFWRQFDRGLGGWGGAELISVDSAQIYRGMDIGSAKPDAATQAQVPHHLLDILDPSEAYSAARFASDALPLIAAIRARGRVPILVGGTMFYFRALFEGLNELPSADPAIRVELAAEAARIGVLAQHARLAQVDPESAARLHPNDSQRVQRALEIYAVLGEPASAYYGRPKSAADLPGPTLRLALIPEDRDHLNANIALRFKQMLAQGLVDEVAALRARGDLHLGLPSMRAVGYRQIWHYLDGSVNLAEAEMQGIIATRQYAKRQLTWLRGDKNWRYYNLAEPFSLAQVLREAIAVQRFS